MGIKLIKRCSIDGCKKHVYAEGLCKHHYAKALEEAAESRSDDGQPWYVGAVRLVAVVCSVVLWIGIIASFALFGVYLYRVVRFEPALIILGAVAMAAVTYIGLHFLLKAFDKHVWASIGIAVVFLVLFCYVINDPAGVYDEYCGWLKSLAEMMR